MIHVNQDTLDYSQVHYLNDQGLRLERFAREKRNGKMSHEGLLGRKALR